MSRYVVQAGWDDVPHITDEDKVELGSGLLPHQKDARMYGTPSLGSGAIYPVDEKDVFIQPIPLPNFYMRGYGLDVGWKCTAAIWGAMDRDNDIIYVYSEHYRGQAEPAVHAAAIKARGSWIKGAIDPAARGRNQKDGTRLIEQYEHNGLKLEIADNAVEAGLLEVYQRLSTGRLKIFTTCTKLLSEYRIYRRDDKGRIVKQNDHAMDALRYLVMTFNEIGSNPPVQRAKAKQTIADKTVGY